jgi:hypothetical protein
MTGIRSDDGLPLTRYRYPKGRIEKMEAAILYYFTLRMGQIEFALLASQCLVHRHALTFPTPKHLCRNL